MYATPELDDTKEQGAFAERDTDPPVAMETDLGETVNVTSAGRVGVLPPEEPEPLPPPGFEGLFDGLLLPELLPPDGFGGLFAGLLGLLFAGGAGFLFPAPLEAGGFFAGGLLGFLPVEFEEEEDVFFDVELVGFFPAALEVLFDSVVASDVSSTAFAFSSAFFTSSSAALVSSSVIFSTELVADSGHSWSSTAH